MTAPHLSRLALDRLLAAEQRGLEDASAHLASCAECSAKLETMKAERDRALLSADVGAVASDLIARAETAPRVIQFPWRIVAPLAAAAALAIAFVLAPPRDEIRLKGAPSIQASVIDQNRARPLGPDERLEPGSRLVFHAQSDVDGYVVVGGVSENGESYAIEHDGRAAFSVRAGVSTELPFNLTLDAAPGSERIFAFFCEEALAKERAKELLDRLALEPSSSVVVEGCKVRSLLLRRAP